MWGQTWEESGNFMASEKGKTEGQRPPPGLPALLCPARWSSPAHGGHSHCEGAPIPRGCLPNPGSPQDDLLYSSGVVSETLERNPKPLTWHLSLPGVLWLETDAGSRCGWAIWEDGKLQSLGPWEYLAIEQVHIPSVQKAGETPSLKGKANCGPPLGGRELALIFQVLCGLFHLQAGFSSAEICVQHLLGANAVCSWGFTCRAAGSPGHGLPRPLPQHRLPDAGSSCISTDTIFLPWGKVCFWVRFGGSEHRLKNQMTLYSSDSLPVILDKFTGLAGPHNCWED